MHVHAQSVTGGGNNHAKPTTADALLGNMIKQVMKICAELKKSEPRVKRDRAGLQNLSPLPGASAGVWA